MSRLETHESHETHETPMQEDKRAEGGHGRWMMIACCVPMLAIAGVLVVTGVVGAGFLLVAVMCTVMMAMMMGAMGGDGGHGGHGGGR